MAPYVSPMGSALRGWSPPFTPSGTSAYWPVNGPGFPGVRTLHNGLFLRFEADATQVAQLLPEPLQATDRTGEVAVFVNQTLLLLPRDVPDVATLEPDATRFHEAIVFFPCRLGDRELLFHYIMYTDSDWCVYCGVVAGLTTKLADIRLLAPVPAHPTWSLDIEGSTIKASVSRGGARLMTLSFSLGAEVDAAPVFGDLGEIVAMRYFPDMAAGGSGRPLVHDLVTMDVTGFDAGRAYEGEGTIELGGTAFDEMQFFQPVRMLEAHYLTGLTQTNLGLVVIHDYLER